MTKEETESGSGAVVDREAWNQFCEQLQHAGDAIWDTRLARSEFDRAEGLRYLSRLLRAGLVSFVEATGPTRPLFRPMPDLVKMGLDNPDNYYLNASVNARYDYRIRGNRRSIHYLSFAAQNQNFAARDRITGGAGHLNDADLAFGPDGEFEILASQHPPSESHRSQPESPPRNWLRLAPDTKQILVRQTYLHRAREQPVDVEIECLTQDPEPTILDPARIGGQLTGSALYAIGCARWFADWVSGFEAAAPVNHFHLPDPEQHRFVGGDPNIVMWLGRWSLEPGEALVVDLQPPDCAYWNFQLGNVWAESLDSRFHRVHVNSGQAQTGADGGVRLVVSARESRGPNWLETVGHDHGTMAVRWVRADSHPEPRCRVVPVAELPDHA